MSSIKLPASLENPTVASNVAFDRAGFDPSKLSRFYLGLPALATNGGRDVVFIGDSLFEGVGASNGALYSWARLIGQGLQQWANRKWAPSVKGGIGFVSLFASASVTNTTVVNNGSWTYGPIGFSSGTSFCVGRINSGLGAGVNSVLTTSQVTDIELVYQKRLSAVTIAFTITGTGAASGTVVVGDTNLGPLWNTTQFTTNTGGIYGERKAVMTGVTASATSTVLTMSQPNTDSAWLHGYICYNGDRTAGLRYHNLGRSGWKLYSSDNNSCIYRADCTRSPVDYDHVNFDNSGTSGPTIPELNVKAPIQANVDQWSYAPATTAATGVYVGACRAGLFVLELLTNDQSGYGNSSAAVAASGLVTYQAKLQEMVDRILSRPSAPAVLLVIPPCPGGRETYYRVFKQAMYNVAAATANVAVFDVDQFFSSAGSRSFPRTWENDSVGSETHATSLGYMGWAAPIMQAIIAGCPY